MELIKDQLPNDPLKKPLLDKAAKDLWSEIRSLS